MMRDIDGEDELKNGYMNNNIADGVDIQPVVEIETLEIQSDDTKPILKNDQGKITFYLLSCMTIACIGAGFQFGWTLAVLNNPSEVIKEFFRENYRVNNVSTLDNTTLNNYWAITNGLVPLGGTAASIFSSLIADNFGRKNGLLLVNLLMFVSSILGFCSKYARSIHLLMASRLLSGIFCGFSNTILPIYLSECSSNNIRGWSGTLIQLSVASGVITAQVLGLPQLLGTRDLWHILIALSIIPALVHCALFFYCETPKYIFIFSKDKILAQKVLLKLRGGDSQEVDLELRELEDEKVSLETVPTWKSFLTDRVLFRATVVAIMIQVAQQLCGINAFTFYSTSIFLSAGLNLMQASLVTIVATTIDLGFTLLSMNLVDKTGRKPLLLWSAIGMFFFTIFLTLSRIFIERKSGELIGYMGIFSYAAYQIFFSLGLGPIPKYITSELFVSASRGKGHSLAFFFHWLFTFLVVFGFPLVDAAIGSFSTFVFSGCLVFIIVYCAVFVPETKNKPIEKIVAEFNEKWIFFTPKRNFRLPDAAKHSLNKVDF